MAARWRPLVIRPWATPYRRKHSAVLYFIAGNPAPPRMTPTHRAYQATAMMSPINATQAPMPISNRESHRLRQEPGVERTTAAAVTRFASSRLGLVGAQLAAGRSLHGHVGRRVAALRSRSGNICGLGVRGAYAKTGRQRGGDQHVAVGESG